MKSNIILIGMPGSGKSTVGIILAKLASMQFVDTDILIQTSEKRTLQDIIDKDGYMELRKIEERILLSVDLTSHVIATGGSAPYSEKAMTYLKKNGTMVFLNADIAALRKRIHNFDTRGLAKRPDQTLADLFEERLYLYRKYAEITIESSTLSQEEVCHEILEKLPFYRGNNC